MKDTNEYELQNDEMKTDIPNGRKSELNVKRKNRQFHDKHNIEPQDVKFTNEMNSFTNTINKLANSAHDRLIKIN